MIASPHAIGGEVTIFDPELDPKGEYAAALVEALANGFNRT